MPKYQPPLVEPEYSQEAPPIPDEWQGRHTPPPTSSSWTLVFVPSWYGRAQTTKVHRFLCLLVHCRMPAGDPPHGFPLWKRLDQWSGSPILPPIRFW